MNWTRFNVTEGATGNSVYCVFENINCYSPRLTPIDPQRGSTMENISEDQQNFPKDQNIHRDDQKIDLEDHEEMMDDDLKQEAEDQRILIENVESLNRISENIEINTKCIFLIAHQESFFIKVLVFKI